MEGTGGDFGDMRKGETSSGIERKKMRRNPSVISLAIARTASKPAGVSSMDSKELIQGLYKGVLLDDDKVKFWIDEKLHQNCFMVLVKGLIIGVGVTDWSTYPENCFGGPVGVDAATLMDGHSIQIVGKFPSIMLSPMATYEVVFVLMMTEHASGWQLPVQLSIIFADGTSNHRTEILETKPKGQWFEIPFGEFVVTPEITGNMILVLFQGSDDLKRGLGVKGVIFRPKY